MRTNSEIEFHDKLYKILAALQCNSQRRKTLEDVLRNYPVKRDLNLDIVTEVKSASMKENELDIREKSEHLKSELI